MALFYFAEISMNGSKVSPLNTFIYLYNSPLCLNVLKTASPKDRIYVD